MLCPDVNAITATQWPLCRSLPISPDEPHSKDSCTPTFLMYPLLLRITTRTRVRLKVSTRTDFSQSSKKSSCELVQRMLLRSSPRRWSVQPPAALLLLPATSKAFEPCAINMELS